jgi:hypothetical protein
MVLVFHSLFIRKSAFGFPGGSPGSPETRPPAHAGLGAAHLLEQF